VTAIITVVAAKIQENIHIGWLIPALTLFSTGCFFMALREWKYFRRYSWMVFAWMIPREAVGRSEPSLWRLLREVEREATKESELSRLRKQVATLEGQVDTLAEQRKISTNHNL